MTRPSPVLVRILSTLCLFLSVGALLTGSAKAQVLQPRERYSLQPGDQLDVRFRLTPEFNQVVTLQPDGFVSLSVAGVLRLVNLSVHDAETAIATGASKRLKDPEVTISLLTFRKPYFVVAGEVAHPGKFDMQEDTTAMQAMLLAGGPTPDAKVSEILVFRRINGADAQVKIITLNKMKKTADLERDWQLQSGDMLYVTRNRIAKISQITRIGNSFGLYVNPLQIH